MKARKKKAGLRKEDEVETVVDSGGGQCTTFAALLLYILYKSQTSSAFRFRKEVTRLQALTTCRKTRGMVFCREIAVKVIHM